MIVPDWNMSFKIMCDDSKVAIGSVLGQRHEKIFKVIYYVSHVLNEVKRTTP